MRDSDARLRKQSELIKKLVPPVELLFTAGSIALLAMYFLGHEYDLALALSLTTLAACYFFSAFDLIPDAPQLSDKMWIRLAPSVLSKILWLGMAMSVMGMCLKLMHLSGWETMTSACFLVIISVGVLAILSMKGLIHLRQVSRVLIRAIPVSLASIYFLIS
jgi:hypothetical protein